MNPIDVPPYELQQLIPSVLGKISDPDEQAYVTCTQAFGSEMYVGCSNGELLRFSVQGQNADSPGAYDLLSRQSMPNNKVVDDMLLLPSISRVLVLCDRQLYVFTFPALDMIPANIMRPPRGAVAFAVDEQHTRRPPQPDNHQGEPIDLCVIKRNSIALFTLRDRLIFIKDIPLPSGATLAKRTGRYLCVADQDNYNMIDLDAGLLFPILPLSQAPDPAPVKPSITVISDIEFLILSWTGASTLGLFVTGEGDPVRGTLEWSMHPISVSFDYPYVTSLLPNNTIEIHSVETQALVQVVPAPATAAVIPKALVASGSGFHVPSMQRVEKLRRTPFNLRRNGNRPDARAEDEEGSQSASGQAEDVVEEHLQL